MKLRPVIYARPGVDKAEFPMCATCNGPHRTGECRPRRYVRRGPACLVCGERVDCGVAGKPNPLMAAHVLRDHPWDVVAALGSILEGGRHER